MKIGEIIVSILIALLGSSGLNSYLNRRWEQANKAKGILEEQYLKVICPIYRELQLNKDEKDMITNIEKIIYNNFHLLPEQLLEAYEKITVNKEEFKKLISDFYIFLRKILGYSKIKISKEIKKKGKLLAAQKFMTVVDFVVLITISLLGFLSFVLSIYGTYLSILMKSAKHIITCLILLILCLVLFISPIITLVKNYFSGLQNISNKE